MQYFNLRILLTFINFSSNAQNISRIKSSHPENIANDIKKVNIIPMTENNDVIENVAVVIQDQEIISVNDSTPENAIIIDGTGKWLIPGLIEKWSNGSSASILSPILILLQLPACFLQGAGITSTRGGVQRTPRFYANCIFFAVNPLNLETGRDYLIPSANPDMALPDIHVSQISLNPAAG